MNKLKGSLLATVLCITHLLNAQIDSTFDWLQGFYQEEPDFASIQEDAEAFFEDTSYHHGKYGHKDFLRWRAFWGGRIGLSDEDIAAEESQNFKYYAQSMLSRLGSSSSCTNSYADWEFMGPQSLPTASNISPNGMGFINTIEVDYSDVSGNTFYAGGASGGLWKTTNGGSSWSCISESSNIPVLGVGDIAIDPNDNQTIYIATETNRFRRSYGVGVLKTTDGGQSWQGTGLSFNVAYGQYTRKIVTHPVNSNKLIALLRDQIYRSLDAGQNWTVVGSIPKNYYDPNQPSKYRIRNWRDLVYHPTDTNVIYASSDDFSRNDGGAVVYKSTDGGANWTDITTNITSTTQDRIDLAVSPQKPNVVYAAASRSGVSKIYKSGDQGVNWTLRGSTSANRGGTSMQDFAVSPADTAIMYLGGIHFTKSSNEGSSFSVVTSRNVSASNWMHDDTRNIAIVSASSGGSSDVVLSGNDGGISISSNGGSTWTQTSNNMSLTDFWSIDVADDNTYLIGGMQDQGFLFVDIVNDTWKNANYYADGGAVIIKENSDSALGYAFPGARITISQNNGMSYPISIGIGTKFDFHKEPAFKYNCDVNGEVYASASSVYKYDVSAGSFPWTKLSSFPSSGTEIKTLAISESNPLVMYAARVDPIWQSCTTSVCLSGKVFKTTDGGQNWTDITDGILGLQWAGISDIAINPTDPDEVWLTHENTWQQHRVTYTNDGGQNWSNYSTGLDEYPVNVIKYVKNSNNTLLIGTDVGVFYRDVTMNSWECYSNNMPTCIIADLNVNECGGVVYAAAHGRAIWKSGLPAITITGTKTWSTKRQVGSDIVVEGLLYITDTVEMAVGKKIHVKPGGKLIVSGGAVRRSSCGTGLWKGIELEGQADSAQSLANMGYASIHNSEISGAEVALRTGLTNASGYVSGTSGGYFYLNESTFRNNLTDIKMHPYENINPVNQNVIDDQSLCNKTSFISDAPLPNSQITAVHVDLEGVVGAEFNGVIFDNQLAQSTLTDRGKGIVAYNASFYLAPFSTIRSEFTSLYRAIECYTPNLSYTPFIDQADFIDNIQGVRIAGNDYARVTRCNFEILDESGHDCYGLYMDYCNVYQIEENDFTYTGGGTADYAVGAVINNSKNGENELYKNSFNNLQVGTLIHGSNQKSGTNKGLVFKCNEYDSNDFHIALEDVSSMFGTVVATIANYQEFTPGSGDGVGNTFEPICSGGTEEDIQVDYGGNSIDYYHFTDNITIPVCRTTSKVTNISTLTAFDQATDCPSNFNTGGGGGPFEPDLVNKNTLLSAQVLASAFQVEKGSTSKTKSLQQAVRFLLTQESTPMATLIELLDKYGDEHDNLRRLAFLSRIQPKNSSSMLLSPSDQSEQDYLNFYQAVQSASNSMLEQAAADATHPYFIWAQAKVAHEKREEIWAPLHLPAQRISLSSNEEEDASLRIFPNPASEELQLHYEGNGSIRIQVFDLKGALIKDFMLQKQSNSTRVTVQDWKPGMYLLKVLQGEEEIASEKISIQH
jgi:photosystem II stability/assembly factor-like uncharacterized protein